MKLPRHTNLVFRSAARSDIPFLLNLRLQTMSAHLAAAGVAASEEENLSRVLFRFECAQVAQQGVYPVGLLKVSRAGSEWELIQIQLTPTLQGLGMGTRIIRSLVADAHASGASVVLSVLKSNPAQGLYQRLGFRVIGENAHAVTMRHTAQENLHTIQRCPGP